MEEGGKFIASVTVTSVGQITIPKEVRDVLSLKSGDKLLVYLKGKQVILKKPQ